MTNEPRAGELLPEHLLVSVARDGGGTGTNGGGA
jgi:hypothetical protein